MVLDELGQDLRIGLRGLLRAPVLTLTVIATVGLGIGATTVIFSAVNAALLRPLPYAGSDRLVRIYTDSPPNQFPFSVVDYRALEAQQTRFERVAGYSSRAMAYSDGTVAERLPARVVTWTYFGLLGITPALGRDFTEADGKAGAARAVIVSHGFWQQRLGGRANVIGTPVRLDGVDYTLAGVLPPLSGPLEQGRDVFVAAQWDAPTRKGPFFITALGRLRPDADAGTARAELRAIDKRLFPVWRASYQDERASWGMMPLKQFAAANLQTVGGLALAAVALVWLIACTNASNLLIARVTSRRQEIAVRVALGASRGRIVRYLLTESALLAIGAAAVGFGLASIGLDLIRELVTTDYIPRVHEIAMDGTTAWVLGVLTVISAALFGLVPALHATGAGGGVSSGTALEETLRAEGRSTTGSVAVRRMRRLLVGSQFAIATPLLIVAGLLLVSLNQLGRVDVGFDTRNLLSGAIPLPMAPYREPARVAAFWDRLQRRVEALPGVSGVAFTSGRPPNEVDNFNNFDLEAAPTPPGQSQPVTPWVGVTPDYFKLLGLHLLQGRLFDEHDGNTPNVETVIVDEAWAKRFFPDGSALGRRLKEGGCTSCPWTTVVGIVSNVKYAGLDKPNDGSVYYPMEGRGATPTEETTTRFRFLMVRTTTDLNGHGDAQAAAVRQIIHDLDPMLPFSNVATMDDLVAQSLQAPRSLSLLVGGFAFVALLLSIVGIYGVMAYYVQQHAKDIGIRLALGGSPGGVLAMIVRDGMQVVAIGVGVGVLAALGLGRLLSSLLYGVGAADTFTFAIVTSMLLLIALVACCVPARRAVAVEPAIILRND